MNRNSAKITEGIKALAGNSNEIVSGTVVAGSTDESTLTVDVQTSDATTPISGVMLSALTGNNDGILMYPADGSNVIIGTVDGPGEWTLLRASELQKLIVNIGNVHCEITGDKVTIKNTATELSLSDSALKLNTAAESLYKLLKDCFTYITLLTVSTSSGTSGVPLNVTDFNNLITRLDNLLTS